MRTKIALYGAWLFATFALFAHIASLVSFMTGQAIFGMDAPSLLIVSISEALIAIVAYLDHFAHKAGALTGHRNE